MKNIAFALLLLSLCSCSSSIYYQVIQVTPDSQMSTTPKVMMYEDDNCTLYYDLWSLSGNPGFWFINDTEEDICLNLDECHFIRNGIAYDYFQNRIHSEASRQDIAVSRSSTRLNPGIHRSTMSVFSGSTVFSTADSKGVSWQEKQRVCVPPGSKKHISEFLLLNKKIEHCDLPVYPTRKQNATINFGSENSPLHFENRISYSVGKSETPILFSNSFYVSRVSNHTENEMFTVRPSIECDKPTGYMERVHNFSSPDVFFIKYEQ